MHVTVNMPINCSFLTFTVLVFKVEGADLGLPAHTKFYKNRLRGCTPFVANCTKNYQFY